MSILDRLKKNEDGSGLIIAIFVLFVMLAIGGLVVDLSIVYKTKGEMRKAANSAALSGVQAIFIDNATVLGITEDIIEANDEGDSTSDILIRPGGEDKVTVTLSKNQDLFFMKIFGIDTFPITITSSAVAEPVVETDNVVPLGLDQGVTLEVGKNYVLKVDEKDNSFGNFGILAVSGPGGDEYSNDFKYGSEAEVKVGDVINTQTGNVVNKTREAINYRISSSPYNEGDMTHSDDPRIMTIIIYEVIESAGNQVKQIKVTGFAYFYLLKPMNNKDKTVTGTFIRKTGNGSADSDGLDKGAFGIKLVE